MHFSSRHLARILQDKHFFNDNLARYTFSRRILKEVFMELRDPIYKDTLHYSQSLTSKIVKDPKMQTLEKIKL